MAANLVTSARLNCTISPCYTKVLRDLNFIMCLIMCHDMTRRLSPPSPVMIFSDSAFYHPWTTAVLYDIFSITLCLIACALSWCGLFMLMLILTMASVPMLRHAACILKFAYPTQAGTKQLGP
ncbi:hypothetical protein BDW72DRAFT_152090 [Aspergillus terricola var. indicus]